MQFEILLLAQVITAIGIMVLFGTLIRMKKRMAKVIKEVENYINFITEDEEEPVNAGTERRQNASKKTSRRSGDEVQTQLIQSVLGEYFP